MHNLQLSDIDFLDDEVLFYPEPTDWSNVDSTESTLVVKTPAQISDPREMMSFLLAKLFSEQTGSCYSEAENWEGFRDLLSWPSIGFECVLVIHFEINLAPSHERTFDSYLWGLYSNLSDYRIGGAPYWAVAFPESMRPRLEAFLERP